MDLYGLLLYFEKLQSFLLSVAKKNYILLDSKFPFQSADFQHLISQTEYFGILAINLYSSFEDSSHQTS